MIRDQVKYAKPDPGRGGTAERADRARRGVGDGIWDMLAATRCRALGVVC